MKFEIWSNALKNMAERISVVTRKKSTGALFRSIVIKADAEKKRLLFYAFNDSTRAGVLCDDVTIYEPGEAIIEYEDFKRLYNVSGKLTVETVDKMFRVRGDKKQAEIAYYHDMEALEFVPVRASEPVFTADKTDLADTLKRLDILRNEDTDKTRRLRLATTGFNLQSCGGIVRVAAINSCSLGLRNTDWACSGDFNISIPGEVAKEFAKVSDNNADEDIRVYVDDSRAVFVGADFSYQMDLLQAEYPKYMKIIESHGTEAYSFSAYKDSLLSVTKEYSKLCKEKIAGLTLKHPMYFAMSGDKFVAAISAGKYKTTDEIEIEHPVGLNDGMIMSFQATVCRDCLSIFDDGDVKISSLGGTSSSPWSITGENGWYAFMLPVRQPRFAGEGDEPSAVLIWEEFEELMRLIKAA